MTDDAERWAQRYGIATPDYRLLLRSNFHLFLQRSFFELNPRTDFYDNWHIAALADKLDSVRR